MGLFAALASFNRNSVLEHHLEKSLTWGHDTFGRNIFALTSLSFAGSFLETFFALTILFTFLMGSLAFMKSNSVFQGWIDWMSALPGTLIGIAVGTLFDSTLKGIIVAAIFQLFPSLFRLAQGKVLQTHRQPYYLSSVALGASRQHLFFTYDIRIVLECFFGMGPHLCYRLILLNATLCFLGTGSYPDYETWGQLVYQSREYLIEAPWLILGSGVPLLLTIWSFHLLSTKRSR